MSRNRPVSEPARPRSCARIDPIGHLLPGWNFFAPKPIQGDFAVWYRSWGASVDDRGEVVEASSTQWRELEGIERRRLTDASVSVNPARYTRKSIFSCCMAIVKTSVEADFGDESRVARD